MRIVTWNTWWCFGPWKDRQPLLADTLARCSPDVVLLQETWPEQATALAAATGLDVLEFAGGPFSTRLRKRMRERPHVDQLFGNAVLADPSTTDSLGSIVLDSPDDTAPRSGVAVRHRRGDTDWTLVTTHLCSKVDAGPTRAAQLDTLRAWADELGAGAPDRPDGGSRPRPRAGPVVLGGDLNQVPTSAEYAAAIEPHWTDLWVAKRPEDPGPTMVVDNPRLRETWWMAERNPPAAPPGVRFDYLLARRAPGGRPVAVDRIERIGAAGDGWPSDHLGIVADLGVRSSGPGGPPGAGLA